MIVVLADDLSGAAELAGVARRAGLTSEVQTEFTPEVPSEVVCIDSGGRGRSAVAAADGMRELIRCVVANGPEWIYLKFDSVLRGHIAAELEAALGATRYSSAQLVTANPGRGRTIRGGRYFVDGIPLDRTAFAEDPEHPCRSSSVRELIGSDDPAIRVPDAVGPEDLARIAASLGDDILPAGSAEFFEAILQDRCALPGRDDPSALPADTRGVVDGEQRGPSLLICGSRASWQTRVEDARRRKKSVFDIRAVPTEVALALREDGTILLGIGDHPETRAQSPQELVDTLSVLAAEIVQSTRPGRILLEGGATAAAVLRRLGWTRMLSVDAPTDGVGTLRVPEQHGPLVLIKPGSYPWPPNAW